MTQSRALTLGPRRPIRTARVSTAVLLLAVLAPAGCSPDSSRSDPSGGEGGGDYGPVVSALSSMIEREIESREIPSLSIALVEGSTTVWAEGFGVEDREGGRAADAGTVYRVGSVSKLFTDIGIMQLVAEGRVDLDAPVVELLPDFAPGGEGADAITLRQLMSHRSGLVREPPVGHYFDDSEPDLAATVASLSGTDLVYAPGLRTKYSNAAIATVGRVLEVVTGQPFAPYLQTEVLEPLGMTKSAFEPLADIVDRRAEAEMWTYHGVRFAAPTFELGMAPAGSMYTTVEDLGRFMAAMLDPAVLKGSGVLDDASLRAMWAPQGERDGERGYGLGFRLFTVDGRPAVGHGGAIYGFSTELQMLPDDGLGVVVVSSLDGSGTVVTRIADTALRLMLAARDGLPVVEPSAPVPVPPELARDLDGLYGEGLDAVRLRERNGELFFAPARGGGRFRLAMADDALVTDDLHGAGTRVGFDPGAQWIELDGTRLQRANDPLPPPPPDHLEGLIGEYGPDYNVLYVYEDGGRLRALIEWFFDYPLTEVDPDTYRFPDFGLYHGEGLAFVRDESGRATAVEAAGVVFPRREVGTDEGVTFTIDPVQPIEALRSAAMSATPPSESGEFRSPDLVELTSLDPSIALDIRYATTNNFMGEVFYREGRAFLQRPAAEALVEVHRSLASDGLGLLIHDAYRPWFVTKMFWDATPEAQKVFVANPSNGSRHNRGAAVDLTMFETATGNPIRTVGGYDEFSPRSYPEYPGGSARQRWYRELLRDVMEDAGFTVYEAEWWHFDYGDWRLYPIQNVEFDELGTP